MKVLVTAASRRGATLEIAHATGDTLTEAGLSATVLAISESGALAGYDAFVVGSRSGSPIGPLENSQLGRCDSVSRPCSTNVVAVDVADVLSKTRASEHKLFASTLGFGERAVMLAFRATEGDFRDRDEIAAWARAIAGELRD
jgi:menaquinone-dependent protoporphyrinogen oxidase